MSELQLDRDNRRYERLNASEDFRETSWAFQTDNALKMLFRKRYAASILEISRGGMGLLTNEPLKRNKYIEVMVCFRDFKPFTIVCRVMGCREYDRETIDGQDYIFYRVGLMIEQCSTEARNCIDKVVQRVKLRQNQTGE